MWLHLSQAVLRLNFAFDDAEGNLEKECIYLKELLHGIANVENLELGPWCIEFLSVLELKGWQPPPSSWKLSELPALQQLDFPGLCSFLPCSLDLETLVIDWWYNEEERDLLSRYTNEDEQRRFETRNFNCLFPHLKTIEIINFHGPLSENKLLLPLVKYFLKHPTVLEKFVIDVLDYFEMAQELLSFPRSSPHASVVFSYR
ncbi:uncharacterized protein [Nicotiana tomentosiformis]|uniref:FBD domain-containing protein n=1 Tax=Nicotiana tabacum TaxID=4097 RepID=A0A1S3XS68_TOBAC|nr:PREDICTED: uncharacterized protein LOC107768135 [Nicotiana tabacum]